MQDDLKSELRGDFEEVIVGMMMTPVAHDALCLREAVKGLGTREAVLIGILSTRSVKVSLRNDVILWLFANSS